jgi:hypothetical protein
VTLAVASLIAVAAAQGAATAPVPARHPAVDYFLSACVDGRADIGGGTREVRWSELPPLIRNGLRSGEGLRFWEVPEPRLYLVVKADRPRDFYRRMCLVYAQGLDVRQAHGQAWEAIWGEPPPPNREPGRPLMYQFSNLAEGYRLNVLTKPSNWVLLQIAHIGESGRRRFEAEARHPHPRAVTRRVPTGARP